MSAESLESLLARLEAAAGVTPVTPPAEGGVTRKPASTLTCTPVTPVTPPADDFGAQRAANDAPDPEALREAFEERAGILEFDAGLPREEAEARARQMVYGEPSGPTPEQRIEAEQLAELARLPRGGGGLGWRDHDVREYLDDDLRQQPAWALAALRELLEAEQRPLAPVVQLRPLAGDDDRVRCTTCAHFRGNRCARHRAAGLQSPEVGPELAQTPQRCAVFRPEVPHAGA